MYTKARKKTFS